MVHSILHAEFWKGDDCTGMRLGALNRGVTPSVQFVRWRRFDFLHLKRIGGHAYVPLAFIIMSVYGKFHICYFYVAVKNCEKPTSPVNGYVRIPCSTIFEGKCSFMCRPGFFLNGSKIFSCSASSKWEPTPGRCDGKEKVCQIVSLKVRYSKKWKHQNIKFAFFITLFSPPPKVEKKDPFIKFLFFSEKLAVNKTIYETTHTQ